TNSIAGIIVDVELNMANPSRNSGCMRVDFVMGYDWKKKKDALDLTAMLIMVGLCASWGLQQVTIKITNQGISPIWQCGMRSIGSTILLLMWMAVRRQPLMEKDGTFWYGIAAGLLFAMEFILIYWGLVFTNVSRATIFLYLSPF